MKKFGSVKITKRINKFNINDTIDKILSNSIDVEITDRLLCFAKHGTKCCNCGIEAEFFSLEETEADCGNRLTYNLYAGDYEVFFTKDHIIPKSLGGKDNLNNYQTMCWICNANKGNNLT